MARQNEKVSRVGEGGSGAERGGGSSVGGFIVLILSQIAVLSYANPHDDVVYERTR